MKKNTDAEVRVPLEDILNVNSNGENRGETRSLKEEISRAIRNLGEVRLAHAVSYENKDSAMEKLTIEKLDPNKGEERMSCEEEGIRGIIEVDDVNLTSENAYEDEDMGQAAYGY